MRNDAVTQICEEYMVEIKYEGTKITFSNLSQINEENN